MPLSATRRSRLPLGVALALALLAGLAAALLPVRRGVAEDLAAYSPRVASALAIVASVPETADLPSVLDSNGVSVQFVRMAPSIYARYSVARRAIEVDERWSEADAGTLAAVIAHEAVHARDSVNGYLSSGGATACLDSELRAFRISAIVWMHVHGTSGKQYAADDLERQLNLIADRYQRDPEGLDHLVRQAYTDQCASVGAQQRGS